MQERDREQTKDRGTDKGREGERPQGQGSGGSTWSPKRDDATEGERGTYGSKDKDNKDWGKTGSETPKPSPGGGNPSQFGERNPSQGGTGGGMRPDRGSEEKR